MKKQPLILFEDPDILVVNKPAPLLAIPDRFDGNKDNLRDRLTRQFGDIFVVHRIDKETSGVMVFARHAEAHAALSEQFQNRQVEKIYLALVRGKVNEPAGVILKPIAPKPGREHKMMVAKKGKPSETRFSVLETFRHATLLEVDLKTGRTHQIRVHLQSIGHPLLVDPLYGSKSEFFLSEIKLKKYKSAKEHVERPLLARNALHAHRLTLTHPSTGQKMTFEAPLPKDLAAT
ncbi:MAG: RluA family pseudouridine synthase, partial [Bacteroidetes bacterium]